MAADTGPRRPLDRAANITERIAHACAAVHLAASVARSAARLLDELRREGILTGCVLADDALLLGCIEDSGLRDSIASGLALARAVEIGGDQPEALPVA